jgi:hypothetical protein
MPTAYQDQAWLRVLGHAVTGPLGSPLPRLPLRVPADWPGGVGHEGDASLGERGVPVPGPPVMITASFLSACLARSTARSAISKATLCSSSNVNWGLPAIASRACCRSCLAGAILELRRSSANCVPDTGGQARGEESPECGHLVGGEIGKQARSARSG